MTHPVPPPRKVQGTGRVAPRFNGLGPPLTGFFLPIIENAPENLEPVRTQNNIIYTLAVKKQTTDKLINKEFNLEEEKKRQRGAGEDAPLCSWQAAFAGGGVVVWRPYAHSKTYSRNSAREFQEGIGG